MNFKNIVWFIKAISYFVLLRSLGNIYNNNNFPIRWSNNVGNTVKPKTKGTFTAIQYCKESRNCTVILEWCHQLLSAKSIFSLKGCGKFSCMAQQTPREFLIPQPLKMILFHIFSLVIEITYFSFVVANETSCKMCASHLRPLW